MHKIAHICLASSFTPGLSYQENFFAHLNSKDGHEVLVVSNCEEIKNGIFVDTEEFNSFIRFDNFSYKLCRLKFRNLVFPIITKKLRLTPKLYKVLCDFSPTIIYYHGIVGLEILTVVKYVKKFPNTKLFFDSHEDFNNSAKNFISKFVQYKLINYFLIKKAFPYIEKVFYITQETKIFLNYFYPFLENKLNYLPLGGEIISLEDKIEVRKQVRADLGLQNDDVIVIHTGKFDKSKKTDLLIKSFNNLNLLGCKLLLVGDFSHKEESEEIINLVNKNDNIYFLGWKSSNDLKKFIAASDVYVQLGTQSATFQLAICSGLSVISQYHDSYVELIDGNGYFVNSVYEFELSIRNIVENSCLLKEMELQSFRIAKERLNYQLISRVFISDSV